MTVATKKLSQLHSDERGAMMLMSIFMAMIMVAMLYYVAAVGESVAFRERIQDGATSDADGRFVLHGTGDRITVWHPDRSATTVPVSRARRASSTAVVMHHRGRERTNSNLHEDDGGLGLPYRVIATAAGDLGAPAAKKYDIEVWLPSEGRYRELTSCSNYTDYSARRMGTRVRAESGNELVHTLNGTAAAIGRTLLNLFEHGQRSDGRFVVPEVLVPICGFESVPVPG